MPRYASRRATSLVLVVLLAAGGLAVLAPPASAASTLLVCASGCGYPDVATALASAVSGDTIVVRPGTYTGALLVTSGVTLCSTGAGGSACAPAPGAVVLQGTSSAPPLTIRHDDVSVQGFTLRNPAFNLTNEDGAGSVEAVLVDLGADRVGLSDNVLVDAAADLPPLRSRAYTTAVLLRAGSDDITLARNRVADLPGALGAGATCLHPPCETVAFRHLGGDGFLVEDNDVRILGTGGRASAIELAGTTDVIVRDNFLRLPGSAPGSGPEVTAIEATAPVAGALFEGNDIAVGLTESAYGLYGVFGVFRASIFRDNDLRTAQHAIMLRTAPDGNNFVEGNYFFDNGNAILNYAAGTTIRDNRFYLGTTAIVLDSVGPGGSQGVVIRENEFRNHTQWIATTETVTGTYVDARENDWGSYRRALIEARLHDGTGTNEIDVSCFIDQDGATRVCPTASFTDAPLNTAWPREVQLTDTSVSGGRTIARRAWTLPDGSMSAAPQPTFLAMPGPASVTLRVFDSEGFDDTLTRVLTLSNSAPTLALPSTLSVAEGTDVALSLPGADADGDTLHYAMADAPAGATLESVSGAFSWSVPYDIDGSTFHVTFSVTDGAVSTSAVVAFLVTDTPTPPVIGPLPPRSVLENSPLSVLVTAIDPDGGAVALAATGLPAGASFTDHGNGTATFAWTPGTGSAGSYTIAVNASAASGLNASGVLVVSVTTAAGLSLARVGGSAQVGAPGQTVTLTATLSNEGSGPDAFVLSARSSAPGWAPAAGAPPTLAQGASTLVTATVVVPAGGGTTVVTLRACSGAQATLCREVLWTVRTPLVLNVTMAPSFTVTDRINGTIRVTWLDGAPVAGVSVEVEEDWQAAGIGASMRVTSDANGTAEFELTFPTARLPGGHDLVFRGSLPLGGTGLATRTYRVVL